MISKELLSIDEGLDTIEHGAEENGNLNLLFLTQVLREVREIKGLLQTRNNSYNCSNNCTNGADDSEN